VRRVQGNELILLLEDGPVTKVAGPLLISPHLICVIIQFPEPLKRSNLSSLYSELSNLLSETWEANTCQEFC
jgi:hypothetical protein